MAIINPIFGEMRGQVAGNVFSRNAGGLYVRANASPIQPESEAQTIQRERLAGLAKDWTGVLTDAQRGTWRQLANSNPVTDRFGYPRKLSGIAMYMKVNAVRLTAGDAAFAAAPANLQVRPVTLGEIIGAVEGTTAIDIKLEPALSATEKYYVSAVVNVAAGVEFVKNRLVFIGAAVGDGAETEWPITLPARLGSLILGTKVHAKIHRYNGSTGALSPGVVHSFAVTAAP